MNDTTSPYVQLLEARDMRDAANARVREAQQELARANVRLNYATQDFEAAQARVDRVNTASPRWVSSR